MTRQDFVFKWLLLALAAAPVWWLDALVFTRYPIFGTVPTLLPVAGAVVAVLEGPIGGGGYGLFLGLLWDATHTGTDGVMTLCLCLLCWAVGALAKYVFSPNFVGGLIGSGLLLGVIGAIRVFWRLFFAHTAPLGALLAVAVPEAVLSWLFVFLLWPWLAWCRKRIYHWLRLY